MKKLILSICLTPLFVFCQEIKVTVIDSIKRKPLPYVHIKGKTKNTISNINGTFLITENWNKNDTITLTHIGYKNTKFCIKDLIKLDTVNLNINSTDLQMVDIYLIDDILKKIINNLDVNYINNSCKENFYSRVMLFQNKNKGQITESIIEVNKSKYFDFSENQKNYNIKLLSNRKNDNLLDMSFSYNFYSFYDLIKFSERFIGINNGNHNLTYKKINDEILQVIFKPIDNPNLKKTIYKGYLVVNIKEYALLQLNYSILGLKYKQPISKSYIKKYDIVAKKNIIWKKNSSIKKYEMLFMEIEDGIFIEDKKRNEEYNITVTYELQNIGKNINYETNNFKKIKANKPILNYNNFLPQSDIWNGIEKIELNNSQKNILHKISN